MTTFASPFNHDTNPFTNLQMPEDVMEVSSDLERRNAMVMEEDNIDIDLELDDGPQQSHDEDSMMDDGEGQDPDQQMEDNYQEPGEQDDEILDYVDNEPPVVEVPMTEDMTAQPAPPSSEPGLFSSHFVLDSVPIEARGDKDPSLASDEKLDQVGTVEIIHTPGARMADEDSTDKTLDNLESIRSLYEEAVPVEEHVSSLPVTDHQSTSPQVSDSQLGKKPSNLLQADVNNADVSQVGNVQGTSEEPLAIPLDVKFENPVSTPDNENPIKDVSGLNPHLDGAGNAEPESAEQTNNASEEQITHASPPSRPDSADPSQKPTSQEQEPTAHQHSPESLPIVVCYQDHHMSLFPPLHEDGTPETYLLQDATLVNKNIHSLLDACSGILTDTFDEIDELELSVPVLGLAFYEHSSEADQYSLRDICDLYVQLQQNDVVESLQPLQINVQIKPCLSKRIDYLYALAGQGKGLAFLRAETSATTGVNRQLEDNLFTPLRKQEAQIVDSNAKVTTDLATGERGRIGGTEHVDQEDDEIDEPDFPEDELDFGELDNQEGEQVGEVDQSITLLGAEVPQSAHDSYNANLGNTASPTHKHSSLASTAGSVQVQAGGSENARLENALEPKEALHEPQEEVEELPKGEDATPWQRITHLDDYNNLHSEETDTVDTEGLVDEEWDVEETTNQGSSDGANAQGHGIEQLVESSQSLHSATQPELSTMLSHSSSKHEDEVEATTPCGSAEPAEAKQEQGTDDASSTTLLDHDNLNISAVVADQAHDDLFDDDDYDAVEEVDVDDSANITDSDFGLVAQPPATPASLKRSRTVVEEVSDVLEDDEGHHLKRSRSG